MYEKENVLLISNVQFYKIYAKNFSRCRTCCYKVWPPIRSQVQFRFSNKSGRNPLDERLIYISWNEFRIYVKALYTNTIIKAKLYDVPLHSGEAAEVWSDAVHEQAQLDQTDNLQTYTDSTHTLRNNQKYDPSWFYTCQILITRTVNY